MKNAITNKLLLLLSLVLLSINFTPVFAQITEIDIIGAGYRIRGPNTLIFTPTSTSTDDQISELDIRNLDTQDPYLIANTNALNYIAIEDQNGGNPYQLSVSASNFTSSGEVIPATNFKVKNAPDSGTGLVVDNNLSGMLGVQLDSSTSTYSSLDTQKILFTSQGVAPGAWRIFPSFQLEIPKGTFPGVYTSTLTFTIT